MTKSEKWDFAETFTAVQAAMLIEQNPSNATDSTGQYEVGNDGSSVLLDRMKTSYQKALQYLIFPPKSPLLKDGSLDIPDRLRSVRILNFEHEDNEEDAGDWFRHESHSDFLLQKFTRRELTRWLSAIGGTSAYRFDLGHVCDPLEVQVRWPWGSYQTKLLGHLDAAVRQFWITYDPDNAKATAPKNHEVVAWLTTERKVSDAMAKAIATILRPDDLPTGPRK